MERNDSQDTMIEWNGIISDFAILTVRFGDILNIFGIAISVWSLWQVYNAKDAAQSAQKAAQEAVTKAANFSIFIRLSDIISHLERMKSMHNDAVPKNIAIETYTMLRRQLSELVSSGRLQKEHLDTVESFIGKLGQMENVLISGRAEMTLTQQLQKNHKILLKEHDNLLRLSRELRRQQELIQNG